MSSRSFCGCEESKKSSRRRSKWLVILILINEIDFYSNIKGLSDPYCKVAVIYNPNESNGTNIIQTPPDTPTTIRRTSSLFSCASASCKFKLNREKKTKI